MLLAGVSGAIYQDSELGYQDRELGCMEEDKWTLLPSGEPSFSSAAEELAGPYHLQQSEKNIQTHSHQAWGTGTRQESK